jgi:hypothetical protein
MMKNLMMMMLFVFVPAVPTVAQTKSNAEIEKQIKSLKVERLFQVTYDQDGGTSKILVFGDDFGDAQDKRADVQRCSFGMAFFYPGKVFSTPPDRINLTFLVLAKKPKFAESNALTITAGTETIKVGNARYFFKQDEKTEYLNYAIAPAEIAKIGSAKDAVAKIGGAEFRFSQEQLKIFAAMSKIADPAAY